MKKIKIGKIVNQKGLKGEMKIYPYTDYPERFEEISVFYVDEKAYQIDKVSYVKKMPVVKLAGIDTVEEAMALKNKDIYIEKSDIRELDEDEYLIIDLIGLDVYSDNEKIGVIKDVMTHTAQHIFVVKTNDREIMIPVVEAFVKEVNVKEGYVKVELIEGL